MTEQNYPEIPETDTIIENVQSDNNAAVKAKDYEISFDTIKLLLNSWRFFLIIIVSIFLAKNDLSIIGDFLETIFWGRSEC